MKLFSLDQEVRIISQFYLLNRLLKLNPFVGQERSLRIATDDLECCRRYNFLTFWGKGGRVMPQTKTLDGHSWFMLTASWEPDADSKALNVFGNVYKMLKDFGTTSQKPELQDLDPDSLKALNLIGRRKFVIIGQTQSNIPLQYLSREISLQQPVKVEIFPATYVHDLAQMFVDENLIKI